jgi:hypothetical protein
MFRCYAFNGETGEKGYVLVWFHLTSWRLDLLLGKVSSVGRRYEGLDIAICFLGYL